VSSGVQLEKTMPEADRTVLRMACLAATPIF
jgi:hypothetical protein